MMRQNWVASKPPHCEPLATRTKYAYGLRLAHALRYRRECRGHLVGLTAPVWQSARPGALATCRVPQNDLASGLNLDPPSEFASLSFGDF